MLNKLFIQNFAIIEEAEINFSEQLTIITGETGAGKSILLGGLNLILGERAEASSFFDKEKKCVVEGEFDIEDSELKSFFEEEELDYQTKTIVRREIIPGGKSRAFINDTPVTLQTLKKFTSQLVNLHQQNDTQELNHLLFQLKLIDSVASNYELLKRYKNSFRDYKKLERDVMMWQEQLDVAQREQDYIQFQFSELSEARLTEGEQESIESEMNALTHAEEIKRNLSEAASALINSDGNIADQLRTVQQLLTAAIKFQPELEGLLNRLRSASIELKDIADEIEAQEGKINFAPRRIEELQERLDVIYKLEKKHRVNSISELISLQMQFEKKLTSLLSDSEKLETAKKELSERKKLLIAIASNLSKKRTGVVARIEKEVNELLKQAAMPFAQIKFAHQLLNEDALNETGMDLFSLLFASNKGSDFIQLNKVASGGELSRLMLCLQSLVAESIQMPTLIFDEIDTGVSGEAARRVALLLQKLAVKHQVICITHLPQIAGKGDKHFSVFKENMKLRTFTRVRELKTNERIFEIARMLSGEKPTEAALKNAEELMS